MGSIRARILPLFLLLAALSGGPSAAAVEDCTPRLLILSAFPGEIDRLLTQTTIQQTVAIDGRNYFVGSLKENEIVLALTGIGLTNAKTAAQTAIDNFSCGGITGVVFSGVAGGKSFIGDVAVPARWTKDETSWLAADPAMLSVAQTLDGVPLAQDTPLGDIACLGIDPDTIKTVRVDHTPQIIVGGDGKSADPFGGRAFPCVPGGGDVFGCEACRGSARGTPDVVRFVTGIQPFLDPTFFLDYFASPPPAATTFDAEDMETAAVGQVAEDNAIPFIAFRAVSDGQGDPLMLPGFPFQFFFYRQLAADNAAVATLAFLEAWANH